MAKQQNTRQAAPQPQYDIDSTVGKFSEMLGLTVNNVYPILLDLWGIKKNGQHLYPGVRDMHVAMALSVQHGLNPMMKELCLMETRGSWVPYIMIDGWAKIANSHPQTDGFEFRYSEKTISGLKGLENKTGIPEWIECVFYRKDRKKPTVIREYMEEIYVPPRGDFIGPWQTHPRRFMRHRALGQNVRFTYGISGIMDEFEAQQYAEAMEEGPRQTEEAPPPQPDPIPEMTNEQFDTAMDRKWKDAMVKGMRTAQQLIDTASMKYALTDEQKKQIKDFEMQAKDDASKEETDQPETGVDDEQLPEKTEN